MSSEGEQVPTVEEPVTSVGSINYEPQEVEAVSRNKEEALQRAGEGLEVEQDADDPPVLRTEVKVAEQASSHSVPVDAVAPRLGMACHCF